MNPDHDESPVPAPEEEKTQLVNRSDSSESTEGDRDYPQLLCTKGQGLEGKSLPLLTSLVFGRSMDCDIPLDHPNVSRRHARVEVEGNQVRVVDLGSSNGTFVNGEKVDSQVLEAGDVLTITPFEFKFIHPAGSDEDDATRMVIPSEEDEEEKTCLVQPAPPRPVEQSKPNRLRKILLAGFLVVGLVAVAGILKGKKQKTNLSPPAKQEAVAPTPEKPVGSGADAETGRASDESSLQSPPLKEPGRTSTPTAVPTSTATPLPTGTPTPTPTEFLTVENVDRILWSSWKTALAEGNLDRLRSLYTSQVVPPYWGLVSGNVEKISAESIREEEKPARYSVRALLTGFGKNHRMRLNWVWQVSGDGKRLRISAEEMSPEDLEQLLLFVPKGHLMSLQVDHCTDALAELGRLFGENPKLPASTRWDRERIEKWKKQVNHCRELLDKARSSESSGDLDQALENYLSLQRYAAQCDVILFGDLQVNVFVRKGREGIERVRSVPEAAGPEVDPEILRKAQNLLDQARLKAQLGEMDEAKKIYRQVRDLLPEGHSMLTSIPPWAMTD